MEKTLLVNVVGSVFLVTGILDAIKYSIQSAKIRTLKTSKGISRQFLNIAISNDLVKLTYGVLICDFYVTLTSVIALITMFDMWYSVYKFYPYRYKNLKNFRRPNMFVYFINSLLPNKIREHL